jgi:phage terminase large subunit GpA-like protein
MGAHEGQFLALRAFDKGWKPKSFLSGSEWADANRVLSGVGSSEQGAWKTSRTPYLPEIMDRLSEHDPAQLIPFMKPTQIGGTEVGSNWIGYVMDHAKGPMAVVMPTEKSMKDWMAQKFEPMAESTPAVNKVLSRRSNNSSDNNAQFKKFIGGILFTKTAGSTADLKSTSLRYVLADEIDEWEWETTQGDPFGLLLARQDNFHDRKAYVPSTPTLKDRSRIEELYEGGDQRQYHVPCPHCGELQTLKWANLKWTHHPDTKRINDVYYVCNVHGCVIQEYSKASMLPELGHGGQARWVPDVPGAAYPSYRINALYSPIGLGRNWTELATQWIEAQGDNAKLMRFMNTRLGETWADRTRDIKANALEARAEPYTLRSVPQGCLVITVGVDTQDNRLELQVIGHGKRDRTWTLDYHVLPGNPAGDELWQALADYVNGIKFINQSGKELISEACAIDTGGHHTHAVYAFVRSGRVRRPLACKGASTPGRTILGKPSMQDVNWRGQSVKKGVMLYLIGADTAKHLLYNRLSVDTDKPGDERKVHFSNQLDNAYYEGLVSETFNPRKNRWEIKKGKRNEPLDTWCLAVAASHHPELYLHKWKAADWDRRAAMLEPDVVQVGADPAELPEPVQTPAPAQEQTGGYTSRHSNLMDRIRSRGR